MRLACSMSVPCLDVVHQSPFSRLQINFHTISNYSFYYTLFSLWTRHSRLPIGLKTKLRVAVFKEQGKRCSAA